MGLNNHIFDFHTEIAKGLVPKHKFINKFGSNADIDTATPEDIWSYGGDYNYLTLADNISVLSNNAEDDADGDGANSVTLQGLDANYNEIEETVNLIGEDEVETQNVFIRLHRAFVASAGDNQKNLGSIDFTGGNSIVATIPALYSQTQMAIYTIPNNHKGYLTNISGSILQSTSDKGAFIELHAIINGVDRIIQKMELFSTGTTTLNKQFTVPLEFDEKTDLRIRATVAQNNTTIFSNFGLILVEQSGKYTTDV